MSAKFSKWTVVYNMDGKTWGMDVVATDRDDAKRRLTAALARGTIEGPITASIPMWAGGFMIPLIAWCANFARKANP